MAWWRICIPKKDGGMGFRDLHSFNLAMLAQQSWRLISTPDSLCARVLKAKYYPNCNLLKAGPKNERGATKLRVGSAEQGTWASTFFPFFLHRIV